MEPKLTWRKADVTLTEGLVPNPRAEHQLQYSLTNVSVAIEGAFLHIDPQSGTEAYAGQGESQVTIVPASSVRTIRYRVQVVDIAAQIF